MSERTATQSEQLALVVATVGVAALVVEVAEPVVVLAALSGLATAGALRYVHADDNQVAATARCVGTLGIVGGTLGVLGAAASSSGVSTFATAAVAAGAWIALVATVSVIAGSDVGDQFRSTAWTSSITGVSVGLAAVTGLGALLAGTAPTGSPAIWLWAIVRWLVTGGQPGNAIPILLGLAGALCIVAAATPPTTPPRPQFTSPVTGDPVGGMDSIKAWLSRLAISLLVAAAVLYFAPISLALPGPAVYLEYALRAALLAGIVGLVLASVTGSLVKRWVWPNGRPLRGVALSVGAGVVAAGVLTVAVGLFARGGSFDPWIGLVVVACVAIGTVPLVEGILGVSGLRQTLRRRSVAVPSAALLVGAVAATQVSAVVAPVVAVGTALVVWDALSFRSDLRAEVIHADTASIERRHLGATLGVVIVAVVAALLVAAVTTFLGPNLGGEPLVVVVVGATLLAIVTVALGRWDPS